MEDISSLSILVGNRDPGQAFETVASILDEPSLADAQVIVVTADAAVSWPVTGRLAVLTLGAGETVAEGLNRAFGQVGTTLVCWLAAGAIVRGPALDAIRRRFAVRRRISAVALRANWIDGPLVADDDDTEISPAGVVVTDSGLVRTEHLRNLGFEPAYRDHRTYSADVLTRILFRVGPIQVPREIPLVRRWVPESDGISKPWDESLTALARSSLVYVARFGGVVPKSRLCRVRQAVWRSMLLWNASWRRKSGVKWVMNALQGQFSSIVGILGYPLRQKAMPLPRKCVAKYVLRMRIFAHQDQRIEDLERLKAALDGFHAAHGRYPMSEDFDGLYSDYGASREDWIRGLAPTYIDALPRDPRNSTNGWENYLYRSDGADYKILVHLPCAREQAEACFSVIQKKYACKRRGIKVYTIYTPGAAEW